MSNDNEIRMVFYRVPIAKQGDRSCAITPSGHSRVYIHHYQPEKILNEHAALALLAEQHRPDKLWDCPIEVRIFFYFPWPSSISKKRKMNWHNNLVAYKATRPDLDNLEKLIFDALEGVIYKNDSQICSKFTSKKYDDTPRIEILLSKIIRF